MSVCQVLVRTPGLALVRCGHVLVQVRSGELTEEGLEQIAEHLHAIIPGLDGPCGYISVLEAGAALPDATIRRRQRDLVTQSLEGREARVAVVIEGSGVSTTLFRAATRMIVPGHGAIRIVSNVRDAIEWVRGLLPHARGSDLLAAIEVGRQSTGANPYK